MRTLPFLGYLKSVTAQNRSEYQSLNNFVFPIFNYVSKCRLHYLTSKILSFFSVWYVSVHPLLLSPLNYWIFNMSLSRTISIFIVIVLYQQLFFHLYLIKSINDSLSLCCQECDCKTIHLIFIYIGECIVNKIFTKKISSRFLWRQYTRFSYSINRVQFF